MMRENELRLYADALAGPPQNSLASYMAPSRVNALAAALMDRPSRAATPIYDDNGQDISGSLPPPRQLDVNAPDPRGFLGRVKTAFEEGSAGKPGFSSETLGQPGFTGSAARAFQPYVAPVDAALKLATGLGRGASAGISGLIGGNETEQNQIDRELRNFANFELVRSASPGAYTGGGAMIADALKSVPKIGETVLNQVGIGTAGAAQKLRENTIKALETGGRSTGENLRAYAQNPAAQEVADNLGSFLGSVKAVPNRASKIADYLRRQYPDARVDLSHSTNEFGNSSYVKFGLRGSDNRMLWFETRVSDHPVGERRSADYAFHVDKSEPLEQVFQKIDNQVPGWVDAIQRPLTKAEQVARVQTRLDSVLSEIQGKWPNGGGGAGYRTLRRHADKLAADLDALQK